MNTRSHLTAGVRRGSRIVFMLLVLFLFGSWNVLPTQGQPIQGKPSAPVLNDVEFRKFDKLVRVGYRREARFYIEALAVRLSVVPYVGRGIERFFYIGTTEIRGHGTLRRPGVPTLTFYASEREALKERHRYNEWAGRSTAPRDRSVRNFIFTGDELPGYRLDRVDRREAPQPVRVTAFWRRTDTNAVVRIDVFECATLNAAHDYLIDALNEFESGAFGRRTDVSFGDVAFGMDSVALFARGNLVVLVRKATPQTEAVTGIARAIDAIILRRLQEG